MVDLDLHSDFVPGGDESVFDRDRKVTERLGAWLGEGQVLGPWRTCRAAGARRGMHAAADAPDPLPPCRCRLRSGRWCWAPSLRTASCAAFPTFLPGGTPPVTLGARLFRRQPTVCMKANGEAPCPGVGPVRGLLARLPWSSLAMAPEHGGVHTHTHSATTHIPPLLKKPLQLQMGRGAVGGCLCRV